MRPVRSRSPHGTTTVGPPARRDAATVATPAGTNDELDRHLAALGRGADRLAMKPVADRIRLIKAVQHNVLRSAVEWVDVSAGSKQSTSSCHVRAEEILSGPVVTARYLWLLARTLEEIRETGRPRLPGRPRRGSDGRLLVPVAPIRRLFDPLTFAGFRVHARMRCGITPAILPAHIARSYQQSTPDTLPGVALVLGAGNITSVPVLDTCDRVFAHGQTVLLKLHPLHEHLQPILERVLAPLIESDCLRIISGGPAVGARAVGHAAVDKIHVTGGLETHDTIVWGPAGPEREERRRHDQPLLQKPISAELGNVSPWIVLPGDYSPRQLDYQAENIAASVINNAGCNCVATRILVTWRGWRERDRFVDKVADVLSSAESRDAWYPGARDRWEEYSGQAASTHRLQATLVRDLDPTTDSLFFNREPFTCVLAEVGLGGATPEEFRERAIRFCNETLWGTLSATVTVPAGQQRGRDARRRLDTLVASLRYGMVGINQWVGLNYALASPPWGGHPDSTLADVQSGKARVHNTFLLDGVDQTVLSGPLTSLPRPVWFPSHPNPEPLAWALLRLYGRPGWKNLWRLLRCL